MTKRPVWFTLVFLAAIPAALSAQLITIRTVPVSLDDQFQFFPSQHAGMGGVSIALHDTLLDLFVNPAKGVRVRRAEFLGAPTFYSVTSNAGGGRTLPLGATARTGAWFGTAWAALQQVDAAERGFFGFPGDIVPLSGFQSDILDPQGFLNGINERTHGNQFAFASAGKVLPSGVAVGASVFWSGLHAIDGVDLMYARGAGVLQNGNSLDIRLGALKEWENGRSLEALVLLNRFRMTHDVTYLDLFWDPAVQQSRQRTRRERNLDYTDTWGVHLQYARPLAATGWKIGGIATLNRMTHPKIPNYEIMNIPRDPGGSWAYNFGVGLSKTAAGTTFGLDVIYEPIWTHTWADSPTPVVSILGDTIAPGGMTIENRFRFENAILRLGITRELGVPQEENGAPSRTSSALQLGLVLRSTSYDLGQYDHVLLTGRSQHESWVEWTPTWGLRLGFPGLELRYHGHLTTGTGRPGVASTGVVDFAAPAGGGIIAAPSGPLTLTEVRVVTHQFSIALPLR